MRARLVVVGRASPPLTEAESLFREALSVKRAALGPDHAETALTEVVLAECLLARGEHAESEALLLRALTAYEAEHGPADPHTQRLFRSLVGLYESQDDPQAATRYRARLSAR